MIELKNLKLEVTLPKKPANIDENSTTGRQRNATYAVTEIELGDENTTENTTKKPVGTEKALSIPTVEKEQTSKIKLGPWYILVLMNSWRTNCQQTTRNNQWKLMS